MEICFSPCIKYGANFNLTTCKAESWILTLFEEGEAIPLFEEGGGGKFVLHPKKTKSLEKKW